MEQLSQTPLGYEFPTSYPGSLPAVAMIHSPFYTMTPEEAARGLGLQVFLLAHGSCDRLPDEVGTEVKRIALGPGS